MRPKRAEFTIVYDGEALRDAQIDVRVLAPALLAFADLLEETNQAVYKGQTSVKLSIKKDSKTGSFPVLLEIWHQHFVSLFTSSDAQAWEKFLVITVSGCEFFRLLKYFKGRKRKNVTEIKETKTVRIEFDEGSPIEVAKETYDLYNNHKARIAAAKIISPLNNDGIDTFSLIYKEKNVVDVNKQEMAFFSIPEEIEEENEKIETVLVYIDTLSFSGKYISRFTLSEGESFTARILDEDFQKRLAEGENISIKDILRVQRKRKQFIENGVLKTEYEIIKVLKHIPAPQQRSLPIPEK